MPVTADSRRTSTGFTEWGPSSPPQPRLPQSRHSTRQAQPLGLSQRLDHCPGSDTTIPNVATEHGPRAPWRRPLTVTGRQVRGTAPLPGICQLGTEGTECASRGVAAEVWVNPLSKTINSTELSVLLWGMKKHLFLFLNHFLIDIFIVLNLPLKEFYFHFCPVHHFVSFPWGNELKCKAKNSRSSLVGWKAHSGVAWLLPQVALLPCCPGCVLSTSHPMHTVEIPYRPYLAPCDIVSQRESKSTSQKNENSKDIQEPLLQAALPSPSLPTVSGFAKMGGGQCQLAHPPEPKWLSPAACSFCPSVVLLPYLQKSKSTFTTVSPKGKEFL